VPHRLIEGCLIAAHAIESTDVFIYIRGEYLAEYEILAARSTRPRRGLFGTSEVTSTAAPARTSAARRRRCSTRSRAGAASRGRGRRSRRSRVSTALRRRSTQTWCTIATGPRSASSARRVREDRRRELAGDGHLLDLRHVVRPGNFELELGTTMRELIYDWPAGIADGRS
jgi:hypothetical protein